ncbi:MAG: ABC transporter substrate-binding protein [Acidimicrobiales bacterium]
MSPHLAIGLAILLFVAGCSSADRPADAEELVWAVPELDKNVAQQVVDAWHRTHPNGVKVRFERIPESADDQRRLMAVELNAGLPRFDILTLDVVWTGEFASRGWLTDLTDIRSEITEASLPGPLQSALWNGRLWAAPFTSNVGLLYFRTDLVDTAPKTWEELKTAVVEARRRTGSGIAGYVAQGAQYEGLVVNFLEYVWGAGGDLASRDGGAIELTAEPAQRALDFMSEAHTDNSLFAPNFEKMTEREALTAFANGEAVFMRNWPFAWNETRLKLGDKVEIAPLPTFDEKSASAAVGGSNLGVSRFSRNSKAAKEFVAFASTNLKVQVDLGKLSRPPTMKAAYEDPALDEKPIKQVGQILAKAHARPSTPQWSAISDEIQQQVFPAYTGRIETRDAVAAIRSFLKQNVGTG